MTGYAIIVEGEGDSFSAYAPELPGCVAAAETAAEVANVDDGWSGGHRGYMDRPPGYGKGVPAGRLGLRGTPAHASLGP